MDRKEELQKLVDNSQSLAEILRKQDKSSSGAALKLLKNELDAYGIKYKFLPYHMRAKKELNDILVENSNYQSSKLIKRLFEEKIKEQKCECCGISEWQNKPITLQLHHINGNHNDNRLDNLIVLCPNCHSQTDNWGNKKEKKRCPDCGKEIGKESTYCRSCAPKHRADNGKNKSKRPSKEILLEEIKDNSFVELGKKYGVAESSVRKWCKKYNLPFRRSDIKQLMQKGNS